MRARPSPDDTLRSRCRFHPTLRTGLFPMLRVRTPPMTAQPPSSAEPQTNGDHVRCEHAARCGGCPLIDRTYPEQLALKRQAVTSALAPYPSLGNVQTAAVEPADPIVGYRTRAKLVVGPGGELGLYAQGGG